MATGWLSRIDISPDEFLHADQLNYLGNDIRNWGGDVNGGAHHLSNVILQGSGGFQFHPSPLEITPGADSQTFVQFDQTVAGNQIARWIVGRDSAPETGSNAGSNFLIGRYDDAGAYLGNVLTINRASGLITMGSQFWTGPVNANGQTLSNVVIPNMLIDPTLAKGDLLARSASALIRVGVGGDGQVLTADASTTAGVKWATPASQVFSVFGRIGNVVATAGDYSASQVTNAVASNQFYTDPPWIASLAWSKLTGVPAFVPATRQVIAGAGMGGGGPLSADVTLTANVLTVFGRTGDVVLTGADLAGAGVVPDTRRIIAGAGLGGGGALSADVTLTANVTSVFGRTGAVVLTTADLTAAGGAPATRVLTAGTGLIGGGDLSADRTFTVLDDTTNQRTRVSKAGAPVATRREINFINGANVAVTVVDNAANNRLDVTVTSNAGSGGMPDPTSVLGDLIVRGATAPPAAPERLPVGANTFVLTADNTAPLGLKWAAPASVALTPWTTDIDAANHKLFNVNRIAIGLTTPGYPLDIVGDVNITGTYRVAGAPLLTALTPWTSDINAANFALRSAGRIGVGNDATVVPSSSVTSSHLLVGATTGNLSGQVVIISNLAGGGGGLGGYQWANYAITATDKRIASINAITGSTIDSADMQFYTWNAGVAGERMRVTAAGDVAVGNTAASLLASGPHIIVGSATNNGQYGALTACGNNPTNGNAIGVLRFINYAVTATEKRIAEIYGAVGSTPDSGAMTFYTWNAGVAGERVRITAAGSVGIGTASPVGVLEVREGANQNISFAPSGGNLAIQALNDSSSTWVPLRFDATGFYFMNGNVGVGTTVPPVRLSVLNPAVGLPSLGTASGAFSVLGDNPTWGLFFGGLNTGASWIQAMRADAQAVAYSILLNPQGGNVGIGGIPNTRLDVIDGATGNVNVLTVRCGMATSGDGPAILFNQNTGSNLMARVSAPYEAAANGLALSFWTFNGTALGERMRVTAPGLVGIGTSSPQSILHCYRRVEGGVSAISIDNDGTTAPIGQALLFRYGGSGILGGIYHIQDAGQPWCLRFKAWTNAAEAERMTIRGDTGNVGIGNPNAGYKLDVAGDVNCTGTYRVNGAPLSTGSQTPWLSDIDAASRSLTNVYLISGIASRNNATVISCPGSSPGTLPDATMSFSTNGSQLYIYVKWTGQAQKVAIINIA
jgi:hypothetical protein